MKDEMYMFVIKLMGILLVILSVFVRVIPASAEVVTIPFRSGESGLIYAEGKLQGRKVTYLLDTGCSPSVIVKSQIKNSFGLSSGEGNVPETVFREGSYIKGFQAEIETTGKPFPISPSAQEMAISANLDTVKTDTEYDAIVGMAWFEGYSLVFDFQKKVLQLYKGEDGPELSGVSYLTSSRFNGVVEVRLTFGNGEKQIGSDYFLLDTGTPSVVLKSALLKQFQHEQYTSTLVSAATTKYVAIMYKLKKFTFGYFNANDFSVRQSPNDKKNVIGSLFNESLPYLHF